MARKMIIDAFGREIDPFDAEMERRAEAESYDPSTELDEDEKDFAENYIVRMGLEDNYAVEDYEL
ncbi:hypothetical protein [Fibrobacter sp.]|uniref:hypothetical protein n=1 Tax=Fibrobacter sp. TaxID=35828 RepID=UPI00261FA711|nr:hypothetical protein [Fibrobacter sp.]MDD5943480.1 hypothetical protein [Fibrobacter sp.]